MTNVQHNVSEGQKSSRLFPSSSIALATPAAPFVIAGGGSMLLIEEAKAHATALEIKQLTLAPTKPSDLDAAAQKLAQLATQGKVIAGTAVLGGVAGAGSRIGARMTDGIVKPHLEMPEAITTEGVRVRMPQTEKLPVSAPLETRGRGVGGGASFEQQVRSTRPELAAKQFEKVIDGDKLTQAKGITNQQAADHIGFKKVKGGYEVYVSEITNGNKDLSLLAKQLEGGFKIAQGDKGLGHQVTGKPRYRVFTDNQQLINALKARANRLKIGSNNQQPVEVFYTGGTRR